MALFKCKMCGADLEINEGASIAECEYCGTKQTVPKAIDENMQNLFNRANTLRIKSEFDKAEKLYEKIIQSDSTQSEAYWGLILCKYGIEYVDDPVTFKKVPTCHRASYDSIIADDDYKSAIENADMSQRMIYEEQAKEIDRIQKEILALAQKEESYDVFICYKETDASGSRTQDSVIANDIYYQLTNEGYKVFYAAITLEGKLGSAYEPIIFAALNSAKVMLAIGTKPEYFNAVWVKNEWSRYLKIIKNDRSKLLIPCYRDMDAYELPDEFAHLQAQDMAKIGFINDVVRGIQKVITKDEPKKVVDEPISYTPAPANIAPLLKRVFMFLEDGEWSSAEEYCEKVLDIEPECAEAYLGKLMADLRVKVRSDLANRKEPFDNNKEYAKAIRFADDALRNELVGYIEHINTRNETARLDGIYNRALRLMNEAKSEGDYEAAAKQFASIKGYKNAEELVQKCYTLRMEHIYTRALKLMNNAAGKNAESAAHYYDCEKEFKSAAAGFESVKGYKDADELAVKCYENAEISNKKAIIAGAKQVALGGNVAAYERAIRVLAPLSDFDGVAELIEEYENQIVVAKENEEAQRRSNEYNRAVRCMSHNTLEGYSEAIESLKTLSGFRDADELLQTCYQKLETLKLQAEARRAERELQAEKARIEKEKRKKRNKKIASIVIPIMLFLIAAAIVYFTIVVPSQKYNDAMALFESGNYVGASVAFQNLEDYKDSATMVKECQYYNALDLICERKYNEALGIFGYLGSYSDSANKKVLVQALKDLNGEEFESTIKTILEANERVNIKYNLSGGTSASGDYITYLNASEYSLLTPEKLGYRFVEWKLNSFSYNKETSLEVVLDAVWSDGYIIKYNFDGGAAADNPIEYHKDGDAVVIADPVREGYTFLGWTGTDLDTPTKNLTIPAGSYGDKEYTANWEAHGKITYNLDGGKAENKTVYTLLDEDFTLNNPTREGYTFIGWTGTDLTSPTMTVVVPKGSHGDREYTANWEGNTYTLNLNANGGAVSNTSLSAEYGSVYSLPTPSRQNYTFSGWYDGSIKYQDGTWRNAGNVTLTAKWTPVNYKITYNLSGGKNASGNASSYTVESSKITFQSPTREGYKFLGWYKDSLYKTKITAIAEGTSGDMTLYAKWEIITYTITYDLNGGTISGTKKTTFTVNDLPFVLPTVSKSGLTFLNWSKGSVGGATISKITELGNITVVATYIDPKLKLELSKDGAYYTVVDYTGNATEIIVPHYYDGKPIKVIGYEAFSKCSSIVTIKLPTTVQTIARKAFSSCMRLTSITIPDSVTSIGEEVFSGCTQLKNVTIPYGVTTIESLTFKGCTSLTSISIPSSVTSISTRAFEDCSSLTSLTIPDNVTYIGFSAFEGCAKLAKVTIGNSVTSIGEGVFRDCICLISVTIPNSVTSIGNSAFFGCTSLRSVTIPDSVTKIGISAFYSCTSLTSITIPYSVTSILSSAFSNCSSLKSITIPESVISISSNLFEGCTSLQSITIPYSVTSIGYRAFDGCTNLKDVYFTGTKAEWQAISVDVYNRALDKATIFYNG